MIDGDISQSCLFRENWIAAIGSANKKCEMRHFAGCHSSRHKEKRQNAMIEFLPTFWAITYNHHPNRTSNISNMKLVVKYDF
jgi:hypothetical protein